ncbi:MAG: hypothetical protein ACOZIN_22265 [Myxococcota bacterium]
MRRSFLLVMIVCAGVSGCAATKLTSKWTDPNIQTEGPFQRVLVVVLSPNSTTQKIAETEFIQNLPEGTQAIPSYRVIAREDLKDVDKVRQVVDQRGIDGVAVFRLASIEEKEEYVPGSYAGSPYLWSYYGTVAPPVYEPGYIRVDTIVKVDIKFFSAKDEAAVWSGSTETFNPSSEQKVIDDVARVVAKELEKSGVVGGAS